MQAFLPLGTLILWVWKQLPELIRTPRVLTQLGREAICMQSWADDQPPEMSDPSRRKWQTLLDLAGVFVDVPKGLEAGRLFRVVLEGPVRPHES